MKDAMLIKDLEKKGFSLEFPGFESAEDEIIEILLLRNDRLLPAIPLLMKKEIDYKKICKRLSEEKDARGLKKTLDAIILMAEKIFGEEGIDNEHLAELIRKNKIKGEIDSYSYIRYRDEFRNSIANRNLARDRTMKESIKSRKQLMQNKALAEIFSDGKIRIMEKIFNHEKLSDSELKYFYRSIRPLIIAISNTDMQDYLKIIQNTKKYR